MVDANGKQFDVPDYTINQIRGAIPKHCYERSGLTGLSYVARDLILLATTFYLFNKFNTSEYVPSQAARFCLWGLYGFIQGLFGTGIWVLAHECGHQAFSTSKVLNDTTGWILHSALLVPYFSWKISHGKHHKSTGHMERDMVFLPKDRKRYFEGVVLKWEELSHVAEDSPIWTLGHLLGRQLIGWPLYLFTNSTGHDEHERQVEGRGKGKKNGFFGGVNHFDPRSPLFESKDAKLILLSDLGLAITASVLYMVGKTYGWSNLLIWYVVPYFWVNHWLGKCALNSLELLARANDFVIVAITFLQHTDPALPHYSGSAWNFVRGAAATIDREFGFIGRQLFHGIIETHVLHHYVSTIPFYHADEATEAIKPVMKHHYQSDTRGGSLGFLKQLYLNTRSCQWVEPNEGAKGEAQKIMFYNSTNKIAAAKARKQ